MPLSMNDLGSYVLYQQCCCPCPPGHPLESGPVAAAGALSPPAPSRPVRAFPQPGARPGGVLQVPYPGGGAVATYQKGGPFAYLQKYYGPGGQPIHAAAHGYAGMGTWGPNPRYSGHGCVTGGGAGCPPLIIQSVGPECCPPPGRLVRPTRPRPRPVSKAVERKKAELEVQEKIVEKAAPKAVPPKVALPLQPPQPYAPGPGAIRPRTAAPEPKPAVLIPSAAPTPTPRTTPAAAPKTAYTVGPQPGTWEWHHQRTDYAAIQQAARARQAATARAGGAASTTHYALGGNMSSFAELVNSGFFTGPNQSVAAPAGAFTLTELTSIPQAQPLTALPKSPLPPPVVPGVPLPIGQPLMFTVPPQVAAQDPWAQMATPFVLEQIQAPGLKAQGVALQPLALIGERF